MKVIEDDLSQKDIIQVLLDHHQQMFEHSPTENVHALDLKGLRAPETASKQAILSANNPILLSHKKLEKQATNFT